MSEAISWGVTGALTAHCEREGFRFGVILQPLFSSWNVVGLVTPVPTDEQTDQEAINAVLMAHAHQNLGAFVDLDTARDRAVAFMQHAAVPHKLCACEEVGELDPEVVRARQARHDALDGPGLDHAIATLTCPIDDGQLIRKPNPRQAPGFGDIFVCACGFEVSE